MAANLRLAWLLPIGIVVAAADPSSSSVAALNIDPPAYDWGPLHVGMRSASAAGVKPSLFSAYGANPSAPNSAVPARHGGLVTEQLTYQVTGPHASDFVVKWFDCADRTGRVSATTETGRFCGAEMTFEPKGFGVRTATLEVRDSQGNRATSALKGTGTFGCNPWQYDVCSYAHHYSGDVGWREQAQTNNSIETYDMQVTVVNGVAYCVGGIKTADGSKSLTGPGIITVDFTDLDPDNQALFDSTETVYWNQNADAVVAGYSYMYNVIVDCPTYEVDGTDLPARRNGRFTLGPPGYARNIGDALGGMQDDIERRTEVGGSIQRTWGLTSNRPPGWKPPSLPGFRP